MDRYISIKETSLMIGVTTTTLRRWEESGLFKPHHRTVGIHRRYSLNEVLNLINPNGNIELSDRKTICYSRVSSFDQKLDLKRQTDALINYTKDRYDNVEVIEDVGSGLKYKKKGLNKLIIMIITNQVDTIVITHKDRLLRFGSDLIIDIANHFNVKTIVLNEVNKTFEEELTSDVLEIITVFSAKLYGSRNHKNKKLLNKSI